MRLKRETYDNWLQDCLHTLQQGASYASIIIVEFVIQEFDSNYMGLVGPFSHPGRRFSRTYQKYAMLNKTPNVRMRSLICICLSQWVDDDEH